MTDLTMQSPLNGPLPAFARVFNRNAPTLVNSLMLHCSNPLPAIVPPAGPETAALEPTSQTADPPPEEPANAPPAEPALEAHFVEIVPGPPPNADDAWSGWLGESRHKPRQTPIPATLMALTTLALTLATSTLTVS